jgi:hypothetical protein
MTLLRVSVLLSLLVLAACEGTPSDPLSERADLMALAGVNVANGRQPAPLSLSGLLFASVHKVYSEHGASAARALVGDLRRLQGEARSAQASRDREDAAMRLRAVHQEELQIVLRVLGTGIVERTIHSTAADGERLRSAISAAELAGAHIAEAGALFRQLDAALAEAAGAADADRHLAALDAATRAAALADGVRILLAQANRIPELDDLFAASVSVLREREGGASAPASLARYRELRRAADATVGSGDRERAHESLRALRAEQVDVVLRVLGPDAVRRMLDAFGWAAAEADAALAAQRRAGRDISRLERMSYSARDLRDRAEAAFRSGDAATALDLGSHGIGLLNALRFALTTS